MGGWEKQGANGHTITFTQICVCVCAGRRRHLTTPSLIRYSLEEVEEGGDTKRARLELLEDRIALVHPLLELRLHRARLHLLEPRDLLGDLCAKRGERDTYTCLS